jgi:hypothetical protein
MPVQAVVHNVALSAHKPFEERLIRPLKGGLPGFKPVKLLCEIIPELKSVLQRPLVELLVVLEAFRLHVGKDICIPDDIAGRCEKTFFRQNSISIFKTEVATHNQFILFDRSTF